MSLMLHELEFIRYLQQFPQKLADVNLPKNTSNLATFLQTINVSDAAGIGILSLFAAVSPKISRR